MARNNAIHVSGNTIANEKQRRKIERNKRLAKRKAKYESFKDKISKWYYTKRKGKRSRPLMVQGRRWHYGEYVYDSYLGDFKRYNKKLRMNMECCFIDNDNTVVLPVNYDRSDIKDPATSVGTQKGVLIKRLFFPKAISFVFANGIHGDYSYKNLIPITEDDIEKGDYAYLPSDSNILVSKEGKVFNIKLFKYIDAFIPNGTEEQYFTVHEDGVRVSKELKEIMKEAFVTGGEVCV